MEQQNLLQLGLGFEPLGALLLLQRWVASHHLPHYLSESGLGLDPQCQDPQNPQWGEMSDTASGAWRVLSSGVRWILCQMGLRWGFQLEKLLRLGLALELSPRGPHRRVVLRMD